MRFYTISAQKTWMRLIEQWHVQLSWDPAASQEKLLRDLKCHSRLSANNSRIVAILDEAFKGISTAKANAEKNLAERPGHLRKSLRSVLSQHGEGWKRNIDWEGN